MSKNKHKTYVSPTGFNVLGIEISIIRTSQVIQCILAWKDDKIGRYICVRDVPSLMLSARDDRLKEVHKNANLIVPDGMPLVWIGRGLGHNLERVCGPDLMHEICVNNEGLGLKHFLYGGKPGVADRLKNDLQRKAPRLEVVGTFCPPFRPLTSHEDKQVVKLISESGAHIVWLGISSPKQDIWMADHKSALSQTMIGVGAAFDFLSGEVPRAPLWMQRRGFEWIFRLSCEPKRLWRRYLLLLPKFIFFITKSRLIVAMLKGALMK